MLTINSDDVDDGDDNREFKYDQSNNVRVPATDALQYLFCCTHPVQCFSLLHAVSGSGI